MAIACKILTDDDMKEAARLWAQSQPVVSGYVSAIIREYRDRDDVMQEIAVAVIESYGTYSTDRPFTNWAVGIARNQVSLYLRRKRISRLVFDEKTIESVATAFSEITPDQTRELRYLNECRRSLKGRAATLCKMRYEDGLPVHVIAESMSMNPNAVSKALERIRDRLRRCVEKRIALEGRKS